MATNTKRKKKNLGGRPRKPNARNTNIAICCSQAQKEYLRRKKINEWGLDLLLEEAERKP